MTSGEELRALVEALNTEGVRSNPQVSLRILEQIATILRSRNPKDSEYTYRYEKESDLNEDFAYAHLQAGNHAQAEAYAQRLKVGQLAGSVFLALGRFEEALKAYEGMPFDHTLSKFRYRELLRASRTLLGDSLGEEVFKERWPALHRKILAGYGTWPSAWLDTERRENADGKKKADWQVQAESRVKEPAELDIQRRVQEAKAKLKLEAEERDLQERIRKLISRGHFNKAETEIREAMGRPELVYSQDELALSLTKVLIGQGRFSEFLSSCEGAYLGYRLEPFLCVKLHLGRPLTGSDLISNFCFFVEKKSALLRKARPFYFEVAEQVLADYRERHGGDPLAVYVRGLPKVELNYTWSHTFFDGLPAKLGKQIDERLGHYYLLPRDAAFRKLITTLVQRVDAKVRSLLGVLDPEERWKSEKALYEYVKLLVPHLDVARNASPLWIKPQHLDIYIEELRLGIEYMGAQHYEAVEVFGGAAALAATQERDGRKLAICAANGVSLVHVRFDDPWDALREVVVKASRVAVSARASKDR